MMGVPETFFAARDRILAAAAGGAWYAVAMSERGVGSRLSQLSTSYTVEPDGGFTIKGAKTFCSGVGHADGYLVAARSAADPSVVSQFVVPADTPGLTIEPTWDALGMRATASHDLHLDVTLDDGALLGGVEGPGAAGRPAHAALAGGQLRGRVRRGRAGGRRRRGRTRQRARAGPSCRPSGRGSAAPTPPSRPPGWP